ncbi:MAG: hypothetical protein WBG76_13020 [Ornithinimicrobium sp.]
MGFLEESWGILAALLPSIGLLYLFWVVMKHILEGDRRERAALRAAEAAEDARIRRDSAAGDGDQQETPG